MSKLVEKRNEFEAKQKKLAEVFEQAGAELDMDKVTAIEGDSKSKTEWVRARNAELDDLGAEIDALAALEKAANANASRQSAIVQPAGPATKDAPKFDSLGKAFINSPAFKGYPGGGVGPTAHLDIDVKTLFQRTAGWAPESIRSGVQIDAAQRPIQLIDLIPGGTINQAVYKFMEETTFTNNAAEVTEGNAYGEAALALTERTQNVEKIGVFIPVTDEQLEDEDAAEAYVDRRLRFMIRQKLDGQLINGNGTPPNLLGILNKVGIQTQAKGADNIPDAIHKALTLIRVTGRAMPTAVVMHPNDWQKVRLATTADGIYLWGPPSDAGTPRIWGLPVVQADSIAAGTALAGDYDAHSQLFIRRGLDVQITNAHSTFFIEGKQAIRADIRAVMVVFRPAAFASITGL